MIIETDDVGVPIVVILFNITEYLDFSFDVIQKFGVCLDILDLDEFDGIRFRCFKMQGFVHFSKTAVAKKVADLVCSQYLIVHAANVSGIVQDFSSKKAVSSLRFTSSRPPCVICDDLLLATGTRLVVVVGVVVGCDFLF